MNSHFSHLVWLGAGTATELAGLLNTAERITLVEARETACRLLRKQYPQSNIAIQQQLVSVNEGSVHFTEYNLAEYSAIAPVTGLKKLFPGLIKISSEQLTCAPVTAVIQELSLAGENNALVIDIPDSNLDLLTALHDYGQLKFFKNVYIHTALDALYERAAKSSEIIPFFEQCGYLLQQMNTQDPELPWLIFAINPLYTELEKTRESLATRQIANETLTNELEEITKEFKEQQQVKETLSIELEKVRQDFDTQLKIKETLVKDLATIKQELTAQQQAKELLAKEMENIKQHLSVQGQPQAADAKDFDKIKDELNKHQKMNEALSNENEKNKQEITRLKKVEQDQLKESGKLQGDLEQVSKHAASRADKISLLEKSNRKLQERNTQLECRQEVLQQELIKAEAQIDVIKELLMKRIETPN